jgi:predicted secreted hydrolase
MKRRDLVFAVAALPWPGARRLSAQTIRQRPLVFPADFGAHPEARAEWWYLTGKLDADTRRFGFQVTFFRSRTNVAADHPSRFAARQLVFAHAALSDIAEMRQRHDQRLARAGFGIAEAGTGDTQVHLRDWNLTREPVGNEATAASRYRTQVVSDSAHFAIDLQLATTQPLLLQGEAGFSRKGPQAAQASHYYSQPQLKASGSLTLDGHALPVSGRAWLDHEWSDEVLAAEAVGWDWIGMNLDDGSALTAFRLRRADGGTLYTGGSFRAAGGETHRFGPDDLRFTAGRRWRSPASNASYPVEWTVETPAGRFQVTALFDAQELDSRQSTGAFYWEGLSELRDAASGRRLGSGYLEMTGYAARLTL